MAIRDLFWACPDCGTRRAWRPVRGGDLCGACGTRFRRGRGAHILARRRSGEHVTRSATAWVDRLPPILEPAAPLDGGPTRARLRIALANDRPVRRGGELLGWVERFGPWRVGTLALRDASLDFLAADGDRLTARVEQFTAIQPASRSLQIGLRGHRTWSVRLQDDSLIWWDALLQEAVRRHWARSGRGEVACFQPTIACL